MRGIENMGAQTYCFVCGGPMEHKVIISDIPLLRKILTRLKDKDAQGYALIESGDIIIEDMIDNGHISDQEQEQLSKSLIDLSKESKYEWLGTSVILTTDNQVINVAPYDVWDRQFIDKSGAIWSASFILEDKQNPKPMYDPRSPKHFFGDGYVMHEHCYKIMQDNYGNFKFNDIHMGVIDHGLAAQYELQEIPYPKYFLESNDWLLEDPLNNEKNKKRILKIKLPIEKELLKSKQPKAGRKGPSESATSFKVGTEKKGNDGNMWVITEDKNGIKRWKKI